MARINDHFLKLQAGYLFPEIARRVRDFADQNPDAKIIRMGIGDVTEPLPEAICAAMHAAVDDMGTHAGFKGYGPEQGYDFLRDVITEHEYTLRGCDISSDEIFVSDGSKCDTGNILDILGPDNTIAITDPVYPVYVDSNVMAGNTGPVQDNGEYQGLIYLPMTAENNFTPAIPDQKIDIIYLCYPNNPTGAVASKNYLEDWVSYARAHKALIFFDAAYAAFIRTPDIPRSIYEIDGAKDCAIEFRSFSKNAGFTGVRCGWIVVPKTLTGTSAAGENIKLWDLWTRRHTTKFNGASYITQRGAAAAYSQDGQAQIQTLVDFYMNNAKIIRDHLSAQGLQVHGGENAPYVWIKTPDNLKSWEYFDHLLTQHHIVGTPGAGFGAAGEGYFRLSAFNSRENVEEAMNRLTQKAAA